MNWLICAKHVESCRQPNGKICKKSYPYDSELINVKLRDLYALCAGSTYTLHITVNNLEGDWYLHECAQGDEGAAN
jgi:hypothetical protein